MKHKIKFFLFLELFNNTLCFFRKEGSFISLQHLQLSNMKYLVRRKCYLSEWMSRLERKYLTTKPVFPQTSRKMSTERSNVQNEQEHYYTAVNSKEGFHLYENHIQTSFTQKMMLAAGSALMGLYNPTRQDMIAALGETTGYPVLKWMHSKMLDDPVGSEILRIKPRITGKTAPIVKLRNLPNGTLGREYARFMDNNKISADTRTPVKFVDDKELAYVIQRYRDVHDFVHTLSGIPTVSIAGEIAVKWFEFTQTGLPMCALAAIFGPLNINISLKERRNLLLHYIPWAISAGLKAHFLLNVFYERRFEDPIDTLREELNLIQAPKVEGW